MAQSLTCPKCRTTFQTKEDDAAEVKCPHCAARVPVEEPPLVEAIQPASRTVDRMACPRCGKPISVDARKCRYCKAWVDEEEEEEDDDDLERRSPYKPCPRCGARGAERVVFTFWGSFYGPALFTHVRCPRCGYAYNGRTGRSNLIPAIIFVTVPLVLILAIFGGLGFLIWRLRGP
jgi:DNA-directed RNA polymerase subunit RPC12/RpoP